MSLIKKFGPTKTTALAVGLGVVLWALSAAVVLAAPLRDIAVFAAFQLFAVAVPGLAITKLFNLRLSALETLCTAYGFGLTSLVAVYFVFAPSGAMGYVKYAVGVLVLVSVVVLILKRKQPLSARPDKGETKIALIFCGFAAAATFVLLSMPMLLPDIVGTRYYFHDTMNGVALTTAASRGFPMQILQMSNTDHWYHIFFYSYTGVFKLVSGISSFEIVTRMSLITISPFLAAVVVALAKRLLKKNLLVWIASAIIFVIPYGTFVHYLYQDTIGFTMGLVFAMLSALFFIEAVSRRCRIINRYYIVSVIFLLMCVGAKGPLAVTMVFMYGFAMLLALIREYTAFARSCDRRGKALLFFADYRWGYIIRVLVYASTFFLLYFALYRSGASDSMSWSPLYSAIRTDFAASLSSSLPLWLHHTLCVIEYIVISDPIIFIALILVIICNAKKKTSILYDMLLGGIILAYFLINTFKQMGSSEMYFLTVITPLAYICAISCIRDLIGEKKPDFARVAAFAALALFIPCMVINVVTSAGAYYGTERNRGLGINAAFEFNRFDPAVIENPDAAAVTVDDYNAYIWLRDNTPEDTIIVDGHYLHHNKYFNGSAFSERAFFLEGWGFVTMEDTNDSTDEKIRRDTFLRFFFTEESEGYLLLMAREGCDYIVIAQHLNPGLYLTDQYCNLVFESGDVAVYKLHEWVQ